MLAIWSLLDQMLFSTGFSTGLCRLRFLRNASPNYARPVCGVKYVKQTKTGFRKFPTILYPTFPYFSYPNLKVNLEENFFSNICLSSQHQTKMVFRKLTSLLQPTLPYFSYFPYPNLKVNLEENFFSNIEFVQSTLDQNGFV